MSFVYRLVKLLIFYIGCITNLQLSCMREYKIQDG